MRVCMCVFNSGMNLILIPPTLGMGNSCLNELNSGFKIASICSPSEPAPSEATLRLGAHSSRGPDCSFGGGTECGGAGRPKVQVQSPMLRLGRLPPPGVSAAYPAELYPVLGPGAQLWVAQAGPMGMRDYGHIPLVLPGCIA